jgi:hypothetical protein
MILSASVVAILKLTVVVGMKVSITAITLVIEIAVPVVKGMKASITMISLAIAIAVLVRICENDVV